MVSNLPGMGIRAHNIITIRYLKCGIYIVIYNGFQNSVPLKVGSTAWLNLVVNYLC